MSARIGIIGAGAWGTALANVLGNATLYTRQRMVPADAVDIVLMVVPVNATRAALAQLNITPDIPIIHCAKGLEQVSLKLMTEVGAEVLPDNPHGVLSGPGFAADVAAHKPTATTLAFPDLAQAKHLQAQLHRPTFRPYISTDVIGVQLGGALKNIIAIACGICMGQELGESARASLIARGFAEMQRLGLAMGGQTETFSGLSGLGDLVLTCGSEQSRNFAYGLALGRGETPDTHKLAEGAKSAQVILALAERHGLDLPICNAVAHILDRTYSIQETVDRLLQRPLKEE